MSLPRVLAWISLSLTLAGCAINPVPVSALPGPNKDPVTFQKDETTCRTAGARAAYPAVAAGAGQQNGRPVPLSGNPNVFWQEYFTSYGRCETAHGNLVQPVPWAVAYQLYLGFGYPYPAPGPYVPVYGYPAPPYGYP